jgi:chromosome partitioning protein
MTVLAVCNHKGGTGKTTTVIHLAAALGLSGRRVLVIDLDPQGFLTRMLGFPEPEIEHSSLALFQPNADLKQVEVESMQSFDLLPASGKLTKHMRQLNKPTDVLWARETLKASLGYDFVVFDTAAAVTVYSLNALVACQYALIPVTPEYQPVVGAEQTFQTIGLVRDRLNPGLRDAFFLFTQVDKRKRMHHTYRRYIRQKYDDHVCENIVRTSTALAESYQEGTTVFDHDPQARGARDYANATDEVVGRIQRAAPRNGRAESATAESSRSTSRTRSRHPESSA